jgi:hypothetical protein
MLPDMTLMRLHLRWAGFMTETGLQANNGVSISAWVDSTDQAQLSSFAFPYDQHFLIFDEVYTAEQVAQTGVVTNLAGHRLYDVKSRRKINGVSETLWLSTAAQGLTTLTSYSWVLSALLKLP